MNKNTSITLGSHFDTFVKSSISRGRHKNASEVVRAGLRLLEEDESKIIALKYAIKEGLNSPRIEDFDFDKQLEMLKKK